MGLSGVTYVRIATVALFLYSWHVRTSLQKYSLDPMAQAHYNHYGSYYRFLTVLSYILSIIVNLLLIIGDYLPKARYLGQVIHFCVSFPSMVIVCTYFWTVYFIDRDLIYPAKTESFYPQWVSCIEHGLVFPIGLLNTLHRPFQMSKSVSCCVIWASSIGYFVWLCHIFNVTGKWVYPFMNALGDGGVEYYLFPITLLVVSIVQQLGWKINEIVHPVKDKKL